MSLEQKVLDSLLGMGMECDVNLFLDSMEEDEIEEDWELDWNEDLEIDYE